MYTNEINYLSVGWFTGKFLAIFVCLDWDSSMFFLINIRPVFSGYQMPLYLHIKTSNELGCLKEAVMS